MRGPAAVATDAEACVVAGAVAAACGFVQAEVRSTARRIATSVAVMAGALPAAGESLLTLHLLRLFLPAVARDEVVLLRVVAEGAEGHLQQFRRLGLHPARALQRLEHEDLADGLQV